MYYGQSLKMFTICLSTSKPTLAGLPIPRAACRHAQLQNIMGSGGIFLITCLCKCYKLQGHVPASKGSTHPFQGLPWHFLSQHWAQVLCFRFLGLCRFSCVEPKRHYRLLALSSWNPTDLALQGRAISRAFPHKGTLAPC